MKRERHGQENSGESHIAYRICMPAVGDSFVT